MIVLDQMNVFDAGADITVVTTNSYVRSDGCLVMGRGAALEATRRLPGIALECGSLVREKAVKGLYGFLLVRRDFGLFQVKYHFRDTANLEVVARSAEMMARQARRYSDLTFALNYPGIGYGHRSEAEIEPILACLPNNVTVCRL